jgi:RNA polymerase sigma-70 factor, ECF subfamily
LDLADETLIRRTLDGDLGAFDALMHRYEHLVFKIAYSFGGGRENAFDITQTVFLKAFDKLRTFRTDASFKAWLLRIAYHEGINWTRSPQNRQHLHRDIDPESDAFALEANQESDLLQNEQRMIVRRGLESLNARYRTAMLLRYVHNLPIREIAGVLQCSENMTKNILFRGIRTLRRTLAQTG